MEKEQFPDYIQVERTKCYENIKGIIHDMEVNDQHGGIRLDFEEKSLDIEQIRREADRLEILAWANHLRSSSKKPQS